MKKSVQNVTLFLVGIIVTCFLFYSSVAMAGGGQNDKQPSKPWPCPEKYAKMVNPIKPEPGILEAGKAVWEKNCKSCHGKNGAGDGVKAKNLDIPCGDFTSEDYQSRSDGELFWRATEGRRPMPTHKDKISDIERWSVILYTRTFAKPTNQVEVTHQK